jgi:hypothetical protein
MADHNRWRYSYASALHACGNSSNQECKTGLAIRACVERLWQIDGEETTEQEEIYTALADLSILKYLYKKYDQIGWTDEVPISWISDERESLVTRAARRSREKC